MQTLISRDSTLIAYGRIGTGAARALNESVGANRKSAKTLRFVRIQAVRMPSRANLTRWTVT